MTTKKSAHTSTNENPVRVIGTELARDSSLDHVNPLGKTELASLLQVSSVLLDEEVSSDILHGDAETALLLDRGSMGFGGSLSGGFRGHSILGVRKLNNAQRVTRNTDLGLITAGKMRREKDANNQGWSNKADGC